MCTQVWFIVLVKGFEGLQELFLQHKYGQFVHLATREAISCPFSLVVAHLISTSV